MDPRRLRGLLTSLVHQRVHPYSLPEFDRSDREVALVVRSRRRRSVRGRQVLVQRIEHVGSVKAAVAECEWAIDLGMMLQFEKREVTR